MSNTTYFLRFCIQALEPSDSWVHIHRVLAMALNATGITYREYHNLMGWNIDYPTVKRFLTTELHYREN